MKKLLLLLPFFASCIETRVYDNKIEYFAVVLAVEKDSKGEITVLAKGIGNKRAIAYTYPGPVKVGDTVAVSRDWKIELLNNKK